ncbi:SDR family oxidoreductase [Shimia thalassica]|uniref:SDR family oxidoreductase n=1 Tax=Shimia thalassica TaxID=1715693 RepID=UPI002734025E|nr:SDR family oxidoreductase [Shimia thalassica]MDP2494959.1 SDR family oxidoreductase [Shimia thalassica]
MPKAIVLGGYGLIGLACMQALNRAGFEVCGVGRSMRSAKSVAPSANWIIRDIPAITAQEWSGILEGIDVVVNASGALQDGAKDDLEAIHVTAVERLVEAATTMPVRIVHISAAGVSKAASTSFFRTKARGDLILSSSARNWVILRPTLVLSQEAYGGTALLRAASALPFIQPIALPDAQIQTVYVGDVAAAVVASAQGKIRSGTIADITERDSHSFPELLAKVRRWQGWAPPVACPTIPAPLVGALGKIADLFGYLGWRSPVRTTALKTLADGIRGNPEVWRNAGGEACRSLDETLDLLPATRQERLFSRAYIALPLAIGTLAVFWLFSGLITLADPARAMSVLSERAAPSWMIAPAVLGGAIADILLGIGILWRPWASRAALGMLGLSSVYLVGSLFAAPDLWADPLGPMVKVFPGMTLATLVWLMLDER